MEGSPRCSERAPAGYRLAVIAIAIGGLTCRNAQSAPEVFMLHTHRRWVLALALVLLLSISGAGTGSAGTTGGISGRTLDSADQAPLAGVKITASSPSQTETATSSASGAYSFVSLGPDTYTLTAAKNGYDPIVQRGITVLSNQVHTVNFALTRSVTTLAKIP